MAGASGSLMGFLGKRLPKLSSEAEDFIREHPEEARMAVAVALETAAVQSEAEAAGAVQEVPEQLRAFVVGRGGEEILGVTEAAARLGVSRTTVYEWSERNTLIAWRGTKRGLNIPAAQILGPGRVVAGLADVVDAIGEPELAWAFLCQEWPFEEAAARPLDRLNGGRLEEVLAAAAGFGATFA
ncbi:MAG: helix-turn-helix domain-containing protein [Gammaproteobacteria bacterium]|nr:helix-turn-helix domain-containing protein [Gammaproteobacteria bacterium]MYB37296.1 helix-turn-helix domain-containing protein [Gammaproteobacteria bacterium]